IVRVVDLAVVVVVDAVRALCRLARARAHRACTAVAGAAGEGARLGERALAARAVLDLAADGQRERTDVAGEVTVDHGVVDAGRDVGLRDRLVRALQRGAGARRVEQLDVGGPRGGRRGDREAVERRDVEAIGQIRNSGVERAGRVEVARRAGGVTGR